MKTYQIYIALIFASCLAQMGWTQGCSDPGICTIGALNSETTKDTVSGVDYMDAELTDLLNVLYTREKFRFEVSGMLSEGDKGTQINGFAFRGVLRIKKKMLFNVKLPYTFTSGDLGRNSGLGDLTLSLQNTFYSGKNKRLSATIGVVVPTGNANKKDKGFELPMAYQTTLGSYNALIGISGAYKKWACVIGYQHSFGKNGNDFHIGKFVVDSTAANYDELNGLRYTFPSSQRLKRGSDLILRLERRIDIGKKFGIVAGVLPILRLNKSTITLDDGNEEAIPGTDGITLNVTGGLRYVPSRNWLIRVNVGAPVIRREVRVDGLSRTFVGVASVAYRIW